jgi:hypothetical protein
MRSWTPRRPSPAIEQRLFGPETSRRRVEANRRTMVLPWWQTLGASAVACLALALSLLNMAHLSVARGSAGASLLSLSNRSCAVSLAMASAPINTWHAPILGWTNDGALGSTHRSFDLLNTNRLLH